MRQPTFAVVSEKRWRETMEDAHCVVPKFAGKDGWFFGGVFDGHGGYSVADGLAGNMADFVNEGLVSGKKPRSAFRFAYAKAQQAEWAQKDCGGSCAATFLLQGKVLSCANAGDCRIIVVGESTLQLTRDHNINNKLEARRIKGCMASEAYVDDRGYIYYEEQFINITRAIGDLRFKKAGLISVPFTSSYILKPTDRFIVAASDGLFGKTPNKIVFELASKVKTAEELAQALKQHMSKTEAEATTLPLSCAS